MTRILWTGNTPPLRFEDHLNLKGRWIHDHAYYLALGDQTHLLPTTHDVSGLTPMSPGEANWLLALLVERPAGRLDPPDDQGEALSTDDYHMAHTATCRPLDDLQCKLATRDSMLVPSTQSIPINEDPLPFVAVLYINLGSEFKWHTAANNGHREHL